ncbi:hypothetical protein GBO14_09280 [Pseudoalteromonas shioyasakiensis]|uniref:flagellin lysine-N-methylase n=1 Tax=Pseudoalteromonas shioyasakiensis TaxID=1190813 RepID=UPI00209617E7|nr:flagellin lysine-N-methylase [Pseudoalteromonas shioyasakiensis]MCO6354907.1 hypothetical protein [Pseudoalteromonas shioyasakiensis]
MIKNDSHNNNCKAILAPKFVERFSCIGESCENNCCYNWNISLNDETYQRYISLNDIKIKELAESHTTVLDANTGMRRINKINNGCVFLETNNLCYIHKQHGEQSIPNICKVYPRSYIQEEDILSLSLSISCPEAARNILLNRDAMTLETLDPKDHKHAFVTKIELKYKRELQEQFRQCAYNCLLDDSIPTFEQRFFNLAILFTLSQKNAGQWFDLKYLLDNFSALLNSKQFNDMYKNISDKASYKSLVELLFSAQATPNSPILKLYRNQVIANKNKQSNEFIPFDTLVDSHGFCFLNWILYWLYSTPFDLSNARNLTGQLALILIKYIYSKELLLNLIFREDSEEMIDQLIVGVIHSISRDFDHQSMPIEKAYAFLNAAGITTPEQLLNLF